MPFQTAIGAPSQYNDLGAAKVMVVVAGERGRVHTPEDWHAERALGVP